MNNKNYQGLACPKLSVSGQEKCGGTLDEKGVCGVCGEQWQYCSQCEKELILSSFEQCFTCISNLLDLSPIGGEAIDKTKSNPFKDRLCEHRTVEYEPFCNGWIDASGKCMRCDEQWKFCPNCGKMFHLEDNVEICPDCLKKEERQTMEDYNQNGFFTGKYRTIAVPLQIFAAFPLTVFLVILLAPIFFDSPLIRWLKGSGLVIYPLACVLGFMAAWRSRQKAFQEAENSEKREGGIWARMMAVGFMFFCGVIFGRNALENFRAFCYSGLAALSLFGVLYFTRIPKPKKGEIKTNVFPLFGIFVSFTSGFVLSKVFENEIKKFCGEWQLWSIIVLIFSSGAIAFLLTRSWRENNPMVHALAKIWQRAISVQLLLCLLAAAILLKAPYVVEAVIWLRKARISKDLLLLGAMFAVSLTLIEIFYQIKKEPVSQEPVLPLTQVVRKAKFTVWQKVFLGGGLASFLLCLAMAGYVIWQGKRIMELSQEVSKLKRELGVSNGARKAAIVQKKKAVPAKTTSSGRTTVPAKDPPAKPSDDVTDQM